VLYLLPGGPGPPVGLPGPGILNSQGGCAEVEEAGSHCQVEDVDTTVHLCRQKLSDQATSCGPLAGEHDLGVAPSRTLSSVPGALAVEHGVHQPWGRRGEK
jgi:hypothetical protein